MVDFKLIREAARAAKTGAQGDAALLELAALGDAPPDIEAQLAGVAGYAPKVDVEQLASLPLGTFGRVYADFLVANNIHQFEYSDQALARFADNPFVVRSTATHDMFHVLTGFDAGWAGEAGVYAFNLAQGSAPSGGRYILWFQRIFYAMIAPSQILRVHRNVKIGTEIGRRAKLLLAHPLEDYFGEPITSVRARLSIPAPDVSGALPSGDSLVSKYVLGKVLPPPPGSTTAAR